MYDYSVGVESNAPAIDSLDVPHRRRTPVFEIAETGRFHRQILRQGCFRELVALPYVTDVF